MVNKVSNMLCSRGISAESQIKITMHVIAQCKVSFLRERERISAVSNLAYLMNCLHKENV